MIDIDTRDIAKILRAPADGVLVNKAKNIFFKH